ncbi:hypothetical protein MA16_Dca000959 [Dendrobium catenatum]|uniref:Uncharacterized protein n=1 Tax=Dendrobium catenatum TaxID=906689 RepID=A0A2I0WL28_9ASPA|nr:hypothetical protein MA16_Dca000959 [Dendrobium catenatum]
MTVVGEDERNWGWVVASGSHWRGKVQSHNLHDQVEEVEKTSEDETGNRESNLGGLGIVRGEGRK